LLLSQTSTGEQPKFRPFFGGPYTAWPHSPNIGDPSLLGPTKLAPMRVHMAIRQVEVQCKPVLVINLYSNMTGKK